MSSPPSCRFYRSSEAASRPHLLPAQHSHTTNQKFSAYPGLLPLSTQLSACSLQQTDKTFLNNEVTPSTRCTHTVAVDIQFNHHQESENKRMHAQLYLEGISTGTSIFILEHIQCRSSVFACLLEDDGARNVIILDWVARFCVARSTIETTSPGWCTMVLGCS